MHNLNYATVVTPRHDVRVKTWEHEGMHHFHISVDGERRDGGELGPVDNADWPSGETTNEPAVNTDPPVLPVSTDTNEQEAT